MLIALPRPVYASEKSYFDIDGKPVVALSTTLIEGREVVLLNDQQHKSFAPVKRGLAGGGDIVWRDAAGVIRLRKTLTGGIIYYPDYRPKGVPLLPDSEPDLAILQFQTLEHWDKAYPYKGKNKPKAGTN